MASPKSSLLSAFLFILGPTIWVFLERYAQQRFDAGQLPNYNMAIESISDLGIDYRQVHPLKHHNVHSFANPAMNYNLYITAACYGLGSLNLIWTSRRSATSQNAMMRTMRFVLALCVATGFFLMGRIHGGPREKFWKIIGWHWFGMGLIGVAGNLVSVLAAVAPVVMAYERVALYRLCSLGLGIVGLYSYYRFLTLGEWDYQTNVGLWQRGTMYPVLAWQGLTALVLAYANIFGRNEGSSAVKKTS